MIKLLSWICVLLMISSVTQAQLQSEMKSQPKTREEVNSNLNREKNGVYFLSEATFDDFINYNDLALICFYETGDMEPMLSEMLAYISRRVQDQDKLFEVAMVAVDRSPMLEARYHPVNAPDFRIYFKAKNIKFYGQLDLDQLADWTLRKIGLPNNRIRTLGELKKKLEKSSLIVIFIAERQEANRYFNDYLEVSRKLLTLDDVEFAFLYPEDFGNDLGNLVRVTKSPFYKEFNFGIRVYRRGSLADIKDLNRWSQASEKEVTQLDIENFIFRSTFVGDGPDYIREADNQNMMKFFSQNQPGLLMFYDGEKLKEEDELTKFAIASLEKAFDDISGRIIVAKVNILTALGKKLAGVTNLEVSNGLEAPELRIVDPNQANNAINKYKPAKDYERILPYVIKEFVNDFIGGSLSNFLKTQKNPTTPSTKKLPIRALNTDTFKSLMTDESDKDLFIYFAGPACFSCAAVWPDFEKIVRVLHEKSTNLIFAFVDLSHNELQEEAKIYAFPTLRLYPAHTDRKVTWVGFTENPTYDLLLRFLRANAKGGEIEEDQAQFKAAVEEENELNHILNGGQIDKKEEQKSVDASQQEEL